MGAPTMTMSEDDSIRAPEGAAKPQEKAPEKRRSWFSRLTAAISGERSVLPLSATMIS